LPPLPQETPQEAGEPAALRNAAPGRPLAPAGRAELPNRRAEQDVAGLLGPDVQAPRRSPEPGRRDESRSEGRPETVRRPPPAGRNGSQASNYQH
jgi:hypothetical protein